METTRMTSQPKPFNVRQMLAAIANDIGDL
jgi:hypothetical protein